MYNSHTKELKKLPDIIQIRTEFSIDYDAAPLEQPEHEVYLQQLESTIALSDCIGIAHIEFLRKVLQQPFLERKDIIRIEEMFFMAEEIEQFEDQVIENLLNLLKIKVLAKQGVVIYLCNDFNSEFEDKHLTKHGFIKVKMENDPELHDSMYIWDSKSAPENVKMAALLWELQEGIRIAEYIVNKDADAYSHFLDGVEIGYLKELLLKLNNYFLTGQWKDGRPEHLRAGK